MHTLKQLIPQSFRNIYHFCCALVANVFFGFPSRNIIVIGVTGTNGKTTTVQMITRVLQRSGAKVAMSSTINFQLGEKQWVNATKFTTLSAWKIQKFIYQALSVGCEYIVLETSSHALDQNRVYGVDYDVAVITNVTREHLDYHHTMDQYRKAKRRLFERVALRPAKLVHGHQIKTALVVNLMMEESEKFIFTQANAIYGYRINTTDHPLAGDQNKMNEVIAETPQYSADGTQFVVEGVPIHMHLIGQVNVENALAAIAVGKSQGLNMETMKQALESLTMVPGRMDRVVNNRKIEIIIDYALTPDSMEKLGSLLAGFKTQKARIIWVFGSCGERDRGKRPLMGEIVARFADFAIVTNEDPYHEDPQGIIDEVFAGVKNATDRTGEPLKQEGTNAWRIIDRKDAIRHALRIAQEHDILVITGKGAEETMAIGCQRIPWNDRAVVEELLGETN